LSWSLRGESGRFRGRITCAVFEIFHRDCPGPISNVRAFRGSVLFLKDNFFAPAGAWL
jgi:hypothetical protein